MRVAKKPRKSGATPLRRNSAVPAEPRISNWKPLLRWLGVVAVLAGVGWGMWLGSEKLQDRNAFPLRHVHIEGELRNLTKEDLQPVAADVLGQNFFMANLDTLRDTLAANPWIEWVSVKRWWPDVVDIELRERTAFGYWGEEEMVDMQGRRFRPPVVRQPGPWPKLAGPQGHEKELMQAYRETHALFAAVGLRLEKIRQDERRAWWLTFDNGLEVHVGRDQFQQRLRRLAQLYPRILSAQIDRIAVVDLRYGNGFAVRWKAATPPTSG